MNDDVSAAFDRYEPAVRDELLWLRELIFEVARDTDGVGLLEETLKWGQISYLNPAGTTLRIHTAPDGAGVALYVHCQTSVVDSLRQSHGDVLAFDGTRCIFVPRGAPEVPVQALRDAIRAALTYKLTP